MGNFADKYNELGSIFQVNTDNSHLTNKLKAARARNKRKTEGYGIMETVLLSAYIATPPIYKYGGMAIRKIQGVIFGK